MKGWLRMRTLWYAALALIAAAAPARAAYTGAFVSGSLVNAKNMYASGSTQATTGSIASGQTALTLASPIDFANGHGILIDHAGANFPAQVNKTNSTTVSGSASVTVANCTGVLAGAPVTDSAGLIPAGDIVASCSSTTLVLAQPAWSTLSAKATGNSSTDTVYIGVASPSNLTITAGTSSSGSTTYTYKIAALDAAGGVRTATSSANVASRESLANLAANGHYIQVAWTPDTNGTYPIYYGVCIWRSTDGGSTWTLINTSGQTAYLDGGGSTLVRYCPAAPPGSDLPDQLVTKVTKGAGTTGLTLADAAGNTASSVNVTHDDTAAIRAAVLAAQVSASGSAVNGVYALAVSPVYLPPGSYNLCGIPMTAPVTVKSDAIDPATVLIRPGCAAPAFFVSCSTNGYDYWANLGIYCGQGLSELRITALNRLDGPGQANAYLTPSILNLYAGHAIAFATNATNPGYTSFKFGIGVEINSVPGSGIFSAGWLGYITPGGQLTINYPGAWGVSATSVSDWWLDITDIGGATLDNILVSGAFGIHFIGTSLEGPIRHNIFAYGATDVYCDLCQIDIAGQNGVTIDGSGGTFVSISNSQLRYSGQSANNTYADVAISATATGTLVLSNDRFKAAGSGCGNPFAAPLNSCAAKNITFGGSGYKVMTASVVFDGGDIATATVTDHPEYIVAPLTSAGVSTTGASSATFTNSPCTGAPTVPRWIPVTMPGQTGTWYVPACK